MTRFLCFGRTKPSGERTPVLNFRREGDRRVRRSFDQAASLALKRSSTGSSSRRSCSATVRVGPQNLVHLLEKGYTANMDNIYLHYE
jgi:hypothetical protein